MGLSDHERPLNKRGKKDAPMMAKILRKKKIFPDLIYSSTAVRAFELAKILADNLDYKIKHIISDRDLYLAYSDEMLKVVRNTDDKYNNVFLVSHNPGITDFANKLCGADIDNIPTTGIVQIEFHSKSWKDVSYGKGKLMFFDFPRNHYDE